SAVNLDHIKCEVEEISNLTPSDEKVWKSIRSVTFQRLTQEFFWKCIHNTFRVSDFWLHIPTLQCSGQSQAHCSGM
ncbi:hypothetical protein B0H19DRAFT_961820, partial [Mycena capillaripes]